MQDGPVNRERPEGMEWQQGRAEAAPGGAWGRERTERPDEHQQGSVEGGTEGSIVGGHRIANGREGTPRPDHEIRGQTEHRLEMRTARQPQPKMAPVRVRYAREGGGRAGEPRGATENRHTWGQ